MSFDIDREFAIHDAKCKTVSAVRKRLDSFLATSPEIKEICAAIPFGYVLGLPLEARREGLAHDNHLAKLAYFDSVAENNFDDDEIDATGLSAECVLDMVREALKIKAAEQAVARDGRLAA